MKKKHLYKNTLFYLLLSLSVISVRAQADKPSTQIIRHYIEQGKTLIPYKENVRFLEQEKQALPILNEISMRTESDEFELEKQRYQVRFKFNTKRKRELNNTLTESKKGAYKIRQEAFLLNQLNDVYELLIDYYFIQKQISFQEKGMLLLQDKRNIYQRLMEQSKSFDVEKWLENEENILILNTKLIKNKSLKVELANRLFLNNDYKEELLDLDFLSIEDLQSFIQDTIVKGNIPPYILINRTKEDIAKVEYQLEKSKANQWLDFVQMEYKGNKKLPYNKEVSLGAGIKLPFRAFQREKVNDAYLDWLETESKTLIATTKFRIAMNESFTSLKRFLIEYKLFEDFLKSQQTGKTYEAYLKNPAISPLLLLNIKQILIKQKKARLAIQKKIFKEYINLLSQSGVLVKEPLRNYLVNGFELISSP